MQDMKKQCISQHWSRIKHPEICFSRPYRGIRRREDLGGPEDVADQNPGNRDVENNSDNFDSSLPTLLEDAFRGASAVEGSNNGNESHIEEELNNQTSLEDGQARADGAISGVGIKEGGGSLSSEGDNNSSEEDQNDPEIYRTDGD
jgi:hypothetical protein